MDLSQRLIELRRKKGLTQQELAVNLNISRSTICHYENGRRQPDLATLVRICDFYQVSVDYITCRTDYDIYQTFSKCSLTTDRFEHIINVLNCLIEEVVKDKY